MIPATSGEPVRRARVECFDTESDGVFSSFSSQKKKNIPATENECGGASGLDYGSDIQNRGAHGPRGR